MPKLTPEKLAILFHDTYERLAPDFGYKMREASAKPWAEVPESNKKLMIATCAEVLAEITAPKQAVPTATGAELLAFYVDWPMGEDWFHEDALIDQDGNGEIYGVDEGEVYAIWDALGCIDWQEKGKSPDVLNICGKKVKTYFKGEFNLLEVWAAWYANFRAADSRKKTP